MTNKTHGPRRYLTLDDPITRGAAEADPHGFIDGLAGLVTIDEVQRVPTLPLAIKAAVDRDRRPGRFLMTGSANVLHVPRLSESLAGRMQMLTLWPLSQGEMFALPVVSLWNPAANESISSVYAGKKR